MTGFGQTRRRLAVVDHRHHHQANARILKIRNTVKNLNICLIQVMIQLPQTISDFVVKLKAISQFQGFE